MKKVICVVFLLTMSSCTYRMKDYSYTSVKPVIEVESNINLSVDLNKKVKGKYIKRSFYFGLIPLNSPKNLSHNVSTFTSLNNSITIGGVRYASLRAAANYDAISQNNDMDVLVNPLYSVKSKCYFLCLFKSLTVEVEGYKGNYIKK